ncbi:MAG: hypothetical protein AAFP90_07830 [Planctomycetota bacterium]
MSVDEIDDDDDLEIECDIHGTSPVTAICSHLASGENTNWFSWEPDDDDDFPDAWCGICDQHYEAEGEWNEVSEAAAKITEHLTLLCTECYKTRRDECDVTYYTDDDDELDDNEDTEND